MFDSRVAADERRTRRDSPAVVSSAGLTCRVWSLRQFTQHWESVGEARTPTLSTERTRFLWRAQRAASRLELTALEYDQYHLCVRHLHADIFYPLCVSGNLESPASARNADGSRNYNELAHRRSFCCRFFSGGEENSAGMRSLTT